MSSRQVGKHVVDWVKIATKIPQAARGEFSGFRSRHEAIKSRLETFTEKPEPIDWEFYKQHVAKPGFVEAFEKAFSAVKVPYPQDTKSAAIKKDEIGYENSCIEVMKETNKNIANLKEELAQLKALKPFEEMTSDEYLADKPDLKKQLDEDFKNFIYK
ncbi:ATP synthase subunit d, mitochondrial-like [Xenia sp. Carnegie-2017]|uniref:ATP synthase subunit d, mitochondrial-like n=1 Tax=Xenia sp. Carnegie-2017 TaxID=2897299 RepID=UPI001F03834A|nr:ATP synthase subunit d, mitochondrial-like [Xenia sp. Carnegie-2017]